MKFDDVNPILKQIRHEHINEEAKNEYGKILNELKQSTLANPRLRNVKFTYGNDRKISRDILEILTALCAEHGLNTYSWLDKASASDKLGIEYYDLVSLEMTISTMVTR